MLRSRNHTSILIIATLVIAVAFASGTVAITPESDQKVEITDDVSAWAGAPFVLQASSDDTVSEIEESDQEIEFRGDNLGPGFADTGTLKTYETEASIEFAYEQNKNFDPDQHGSIEDNGQIHLIELEEEDVSGINIPGSMDDLEDLLDKDDVNNNATFTDITADNAGSLAQDGTFTLDDNEFEDPGMYAVLITLNESGDGVILDDNEIEDIDGDITVMGMEGIAVEDPDNTELDSPSEAEPGDSLDFDVNSDLSGDVHHAVAVYDISQVEDEELTVNVGDNDLDDLSADDITVESNIQYVRGEAIVQDDILVGDRSLVSADSRAGQFTIQEIFNRIADEADTDAPDSDGDGEILDASMTAVVTDGPSGTITVETDEDWAETEYRVVYLTSTNTSSDEFRTATDTLTIQEDDDDSPTTGGSGGSPSADDEDDVVDDEDDIVDTPDADDLPPETPTVQEVRDELDQTEPNTQSSTPIADNAPDRPGVTVNPEETESVNEITFSSDDASGNVDIREWQDPPESVSQSISGSVAAQVEDDSEANVEATASIPTVADIDPDSDEVRSESGTVQMTVEETRLDNPEEATIAHERGDSWELLETTVSETEDGEVTLEAETESFSLFAVSEVETEEEDEPADEAEEPDDGIGTTGLIGLLVVLALIVAAAVAYRRLNSGDNNSGL